MKTIRLEHRIGHFKFYELWAGAYVNNETGKADKAFVGTRYGKIGTEGQVKLIEFEGPNCSSDAHSFVQKKVGEKQDRGYDIVDTTGDVASDAIDISRHPPETEKAETEGSEQLSIF